MKFRGVLGGHALAILVAAFGCHSMVPIGGVPFNSEAHAPRQKEHVHA